MAIEQEHFDKAVAVAREFGARKLILFGSAAESPPAARDLDLLCEGVEGWDLFRLGARLEEELPVPVDLVPYGPDDPFCHCVAARGRVLYERQ